MWEKIKAFLLKIWGPVATVLAVLLGVFGILSKRGSNGRRGDYQRIVAELSRERELVARARVALEDERGSISRERERLGDERDILDRERENDARMGELANRDRELLEELRRRHDEHNNTTAVRLDSNGSSGGD